MFHSVHTHDRRSMATLVATLALTASFLVVGPSGTNAQSSPPAKKLLVGSWLETVTFPPEFGRPPLRSLSSYHDDGTMSCTDQGNVTTAPAMVFSACHGAWTHLHNRTFAYTAFELISDLSGNLVGLLKFRGTYTVSTSGAEYEGTTVAEILDTEGNVLTSVTVVNAGRRIQVELP